MKRFKQKKQTNQSRIAECIVRHNSVSRKEISDMTGITPATVTTTVATMIEEGIVREIGEIEESQGSIGRRRIALDLVSSYKYVIGAEFNEIALSVTITDLKGEILLGNTKPYTTEISDHINQALVDAITDAMVQSKIPTSSFAGIGIAVPGHFDPYTRKLVSNNAVWKNFDGKQIEEALPLAVKFENDVRCMALAQFLFHPAETPSSFAFFHVGMGLFCANMIDDELFLGSGYVSGEIGHSTIDPEGPLCGCGKRGCLQAVASEQKIIERSRALFDMERASVLHNFVFAKEEITLDHIVAAYNAGDPGICLMLNNAIRYLGIAVSNVAILMNPDKIFLHGRLFQHETLCNQLKIQFTQQLNFLHEFSPIPYDLAFLKYAPTNGAVGGAALATIRCFIEA